MVKKLIFHDTFEITLAQKMYFLLCNHIIITKKFLPTDWYINFSIFGIIINVSLLIIFSACPEKISEFEENKLQRKKQNNQKRRPKKKETVFSTAELDLKLQNLLLDSNLGDQTNLNASDSSKRILEETTAMAEADLNTRDLLLSHEIDHIRLIQNISNLSNNEAVSSVDKNVVIDLLSPTPLKSSRTSKFHESSDQHIEVINLSDSENDVSPEHKQKAKELRLFLASIRNQIH